VNLLGENGRPVLSVYPARNASQREAGGSVPLATLGPELVEWERVVKYVVTERVMGSSL